MGLFDKDKISEMADKAKNSIKETYAEVKAEDERKKKLGLLKNTIVKLDYKGGHPSLPKEKECTLKITNDDMTISYGFSSATIEFGNIKGINYENAEQISRRITAVRMLALGPFALAFKKKTKDSEKYLTVEFIENGIDGAVLFGGKKVQEAYTKVFERYSNFKTRQELENADSIEPEESEIDIGNSFSTDPFEKLKKLKELLDMGIISQEEFDTKKKELLY